MTTVVVDQGLSTGSNLNHSLGAVTGSHAEQCNGEVYQLQFNLIVFDTSNFIRSLMIVTSRNPFIYLLQLILCIILFLVYPALYLSYNYFFV